jgi:putative peptidoglycan lipid II flippase
MITLRIAVAAALLAGVSWLVWDLLDHLLGRTIGAQIVAIGAAAAAGGFIYMRAVLAMRIPEARQVRSLVLGRLGRA